MLGAMRPRYGCGAGGEGAACALPVGAAFSGAAVPLGGGADVGEGGEPSGVGAGAGGAAGLPMPMRLWGCCASGSTSGPFCPHAGKAAAMQATTSRPMVRICPV